MAGGRIIQKARTQNENSQATPTPGQATVATAIVFAT